MINGLPTVEESYGVEIVRKGIHLFSLSIPVVYYFITKETALAILLPLTALFAGTDLLRFRHAALGEFYHRHLGWLLRPHEIDRREPRLNGATYVLLSACICILLFPKLIVLTAFAILIISDTSAALIGRRYGTHRFLGKTLEGSGAFLVTALAVVALSPKLGTSPAEYLIGAAGAATGTVVESLPTRIDDNLSIPIAIAAVMWVLYALFLPHLNVFALDIG